MATSGKLLIQCDWNHSYRESNSKFWVTYKCADRPSVHSHVLCHRDVNNEVTLTTEHPSFQISHHSPTGLKLSYTDSEGSTTSCLFRSASKEYEPHGKNRKVTCLDATSGGLALSSVENENSISIWETSTGDVRRQLAGHAGDVYRAKFFPSGVVVLSGGADTQLKVWSAETGECAATMVGHKAAVMDFDFVEKGRNVVSCSRDGTANLWDVSKQLCIHSFTSNGLGTINACALRRCAHLCRELSSPSAGEVGTDHKLFLLALESGKIAGFNLATRQQVLEVIPPELSAVNCISFISEDHFIAGVDGGEVLVYDLRNFSAPVRRCNEFSKILSTCPYKQGFLYSAGDGSVVCVDEMWTPFCKLTGADCDPVYQTCVKKNIPHDSCQQDIFVHEHSTHSVTIDSASSSIVSIS